MDDEMDFANKCSANSGKIKLTITVEDIALGEVKHSKMLTIQDIEFELQFLVSKYNRARTITSPQVLILQAKSLDTTISIEYEIEIIEVPDYKPGPKLKKCIFSSTGKKSTTKDTQIIVQTIGIKKGRFEGLLNTNKKVTYIVKITLPPTTKIPDIRMFLKPPVESTPEQIFTLQIENFHKTQSHSMQFKIANYPEITDNEVNTFRALLKMHYSGKAKMLNLLTDKLKVSSNRTDQINEEQVSSEQASLKQVTSSIGNLDINSEPESSFLNDGEEENNNLDTLLEKVLNETQIEALLQIEFDFINFCNSFNDDQKKRNYLYFIMNPFKTNDLPMRGIEIIKKLIKKLIKNSSDSSISVTLRELIRLDSRLFVDFVNSIFYIGKGEDNRYKVHFKNAANLIKNSSLDTPESGQTPSTSSPNVRSAKQEEEIGEIWRKNILNRNPILAFCIENIDNAEAIEREGILISILKTQLQYQNSSGNKFAAKEPEKRKELGMYHLLQYFVLFLLNEKENQMLLEKF